MTAVAVPPKHIFINGKRIKHRWFQNLLWTLVSTSLTVAAVAATYYITTQKGIFFPKSKWDSLLPYTWWTNYRHGLRDVGEPVIAAMLVHSFIVASWKKLSAKAASGWKLVMHVVIAIVSAFALIIFGTGIIDYVLPKSISTGSVNTGVAGTLNYTFAIAFVFSFAVVHVIKFVWAPVGNAIASGLTELAVRRANGKLPLWVRLPLAPPSMRERFVWVQEHTAVADMQAGVLLRWLLAFGALVYAALVIYGEIVLHVIAKGH